MIHAVNLIADKISRVNNETVYIANIHSKKADFK